MDAQLTALEVWRKAIACHPAADIDGFAALFAADGVMEIPFGVPGVPSRIEGRAEILRVLGPLWRRSKESGRRISGLGRVIAHTMLDPELVVIEFDVNGVDGAGTPFRLAYVHIVQVRDGHIVRLRDYVDSWAIGQQLQSMVASPPKSPT